MKVSSYVLLIFGLRRLLDYFKEEIRITLLCLLDVNNFQQSRTTVINSHALATIGLHRLSYYKILPTRTEHFESPVNCPSW